VKKAGGSQAGKPWPRLTEFVLIANGVIVDQMVGLSKPASLLATVEELFIKY
jgi:hypothetical protein